MAEKGKAKFRVGQVVYLRTDNRFMKIGSKSLQGRWYYWENNSNSIGWGEVELRALTRRERGA
jgi:hypothetical protein